MKPEKPLYYIEWIIGASAGAFITWTQLGQSLLSIITAIVITVITFFVKRYLDKKYPKKQHGKG